MYSVVLPVGTTRTRIPSTRLAERLDATVSVLDPALTAKELLVAAIGVRIVEVGATALELVHGKRADITPGSEEPFVVTVQVR
jgi:hypothetical protein